MPSTTDAVVIVGPPPATPEAEERRLSASPLIAQELWTYQDGVEHLLDVFDVPRGDRSLRLAKRALLHAHRMFPSYHQWPYYRRLHVVHTVPPYNTGSVEFDYTGGAYERLVTLTDGVFPDWAAFGVIRLESVDYPVLQRISDTQCTLSPTRSPPDDLDADSAFLLFRNHYPLPVDFRRGDRMVDQMTGRELCTVSPPELTGQQLHQRGTTTPYIITIVEDEDHIGGLALHINAPSSLAQYSFLYERQPRPMSLELYDLGTLSIEDNSAEIVGDDDTAFTRKMIGSVLRISENDEAPTSKVGSITSADANPAAYTRIILDVLDSHTLLVDQILEETDTGRAFTISDPLDVHVQSMLDAFLRCSEAEFARTLNRVDAINRMQQFWVALDLARDAARHLTTIKTANIWDEDMTGYSLLGTVNVRPT